MKILSNRTHPVNFFLLQFCGSLFCRTAHSLNSLNSFNAILYRVCTIYMDCSLADKYNDTWMFSDEEGDEQGRTETFHY